MEFNNVKFETYIPKNFIDTLRNTLNEIDALTIGNYDSCMAYSKVTGSWRPLKGANPYEGELGKLCIANEYKVEFRCSIDLMEKAYKKIKEVHPYEEPVINVFPLLR